MRSNDAADTQFYQTLKIQIFFTVYNRSIFIVLFFIMYGNVQKETYELNYFQIAPEAIRSIKTVEDTLKQN